jgi:hypothetical protein
MNVEKRENGEMAYIMASRPWAGLGFVIFPLILISAVSPIV